MQIYLATESRPHLVTAMFATGALSFPLKRDATFGDLAEFVASLAKRRGSQPLSVDIRVNA